MSTFDGVSHRLILESWIKQNRFTHVAEIGVKKGNTYLHLLENCADLNLIGVDIWENKTEKLPEHWKRLRQIVTEQYPKRATLIRARSVEAAKAVSDHSLDMVFIDADHSEEAVRADILAWRPKIKPGGLLCGHDIHMAGVHNAVEALCPGWKKSDQKIWQITCDPVVTTVIPYADDRNYGRACNEIVAAMPEHHWFCVMDHDAMFTTPEWHRQLTRAIRRQPLGCFTVMTNRIKCPYQRPPGIDKNNHDIAYHRQIGAGLLRNEGLRDVTDDREPSGVVMAMPKRAWRDAGGFPEGLHYVDRMMWLALKLAGRRIYLIEGLYVYHWHRGAGEAIQAGEWATQHRLPDGKMLVLKPNGKLPVYGAKIG